MKTTAKGNDNKVNGNSWYFTEVALVLLLNLVLNPAAGFAGEKNSVSAEIWANYILPSDVKDQTGKITENGFFIRLGYHHLMANDLPFDIKAGGDHYFFKNDTVVDLPEKAKARGAWVKSEIPLPFINDNRYLFGLELNPMFQSAKGTDFDGDAFRFNFSPVFIFKNDEANFEFVVGAKIRPEYDKVVLPVLGFNYKVNDKLSVNLVSDNPNIAYQITDRTRALWEFNYIVDEFEVTEGPRDGAIIELQNFTTGLGLEHNFNKNFRGRLSAGGVFDRIIKYQDDTGKVVPEPSVYFSLDLKVNF